MWKGIDFTRINANKALTSSQMKQVGHATCNLIKLHKDEKSRKNPIKNQ